MIIVTTDNINGKEFEMLGLVKGSTIQTVNAFRDIGAGFKTLVGGELKKYNEMMDKARDLATSRMVDEARSLGADAIVGVFAFQKCPFPFAPGSLGFMGCRISQCSASCPPSSL